MCWYGSCRINVALFIPTVNKEEILTKGSAQTSISQANGRETSIGTALTNDSFCLTLTLFDNSKYYICSDCPGGLECNKVMALVGYNVALLIFFTVNKEETLTKGSTQISLSQVNGLQGNRRDTSIGTALIDGNFLLARAFLTIQNIIYISFVY